MAEMRIDLDRIVADFEAAQTRLASAEDLLAEAQQEVDDARRNLTLRRDFLNALNNYAINEDGDPDAPTVAGPLAGKSGMEAAKTFMMMNPGKEMRFADIYAQMLKQGFEGTSNAAGVAFATMAREGTVRRLSKGLYKIPDAESVRFLEADWAHLLDPEAHPRQAIYFDTTALKALFPAKSQEPTVIEGFDLDLSFAHPDEAAENDREDERSPRSIEAETG